MAEITQEDHDFLVENFESFDRAEQEHALNLIDEFRQTQLEATSDPGSPATVAGLKFRSVIGVGEGIAATAANAMEYGMLAGEFTNRAIGDPLGLADGIQELRSNFQEVRNQVTTKYHASIIDAFGEEAVEAPIANFIGEGLFWLPLAAATVPTTLTRMAWANMGTGALVGGVAAAPEAEGLEDTFGSMTVGGLAGLGATMILAPVSARNFVARKYTEALDSPEGQTALKLEKEVQELTGNPEFSFTVGQIRADNPWIVGLEVGSAGSRTLQKQNDAVNTLTEFLKRRVDKFDLNQFLKTSGAVMRETVKAKRKGASQVYEAGLNGISERFGGKFALDGRKYLSALQREAARLKDPARLGRQNTDRLAKHIKFVDKEVIPYRMQESVIDKKKVFQVIQKDGGKVEKTFKTREAAVQHLDDLNREHGGIDAETAVRILQGHNEVIGGESSVFKNAAPGSETGIAKYLKREFLASLNSGDDEAAQAILKLQKGYEFEMQQLRALEDSQLAIILGTTEKAARKAMQNPEKVMTRLASMDAGAMKQATAFLQETSPGLVDDMKALVIGNALNKAFAGRGGRQAVVKGPDIGKMGKALEGKNLLGDDPTGLVGKNLFTATEQADLVTTGKAIQTLLNTYQRNIKADTAGAMRDATINVISRSAEFFGRWLAGVLSKGRGVERLMVDPHARAMLQRLAKTGPGGAGGRAAITYLTYASSAIAAEKNRQERRDIEQSQRQFSEQRQ